MVSECLHCREQHIGLQTDADVRRNEEQNLSFQAHRKHKCQTRSKVMTFFKSYPSSVFTAY